MSTIAREYTNKLVGMLDDGELDAHTLAKELLGWMSEQDVKEFYESNIDDSDEEDDVDAVDDSDEED